MSTKHGVLAGVGGDVQVFKGIPFAAPPVGELRWRPPQAVQPWTGVRPATEFGPDPYQDVRGRAVSEDCLYLNVWTPTLHPREPLPVMIWVFGGGFTGGSGALDGASFARKGVVLVTINYRVGLFGFLAHRMLTQESPHHSSGNYGLLDQLAAIRWVHDNIAAFGGDANRVTAFGQSAGASSLSVLLTSPMMRNLVHRVILQSPGAMRPLSPLGEAEIAGDLMGTDLAAMRALSAEAVLQKTSRFVPPVRGLTTPRGVGPVFDGWVVPYPDEAAAFAAGGVNQVDMIVGSNANEGIEFVKNWPVTTVAHYRELLVGNFGSAADEVFARYPVQTDDEVRAQLSALFGDTQFQFGVRGMARGMAALGSPVFRYYFSRHRNDEATAPNHGAELPYVFERFERMRDGKMERLALNEQDFRLSAAMRDAWIRFAVSGNPNGGSLPLWPAYDAAMDTYLEFGDRIVVGHGLRTSQLDLLEKLFIGRRMKP